MTGRLFVTLPADVDAGLSWTRISADGRVSGQGVLPAGSRLETDAGDHVVVEVPGEEVTIRWLDLKAASAAQARAAAIHAARDEAASADPLHVAAAPDADSAAGWPVAIVSKDLMTSWLARLAVSGIDADVLTPTQLLIPRPDHGFVAARIAGGLAVRGQTDAFVGDAALAAMIVGDGELREISSVQEVLALKLAESERPLINLRQGNFAKLRVNADPDMWRRLALISLTALIIFLLAVAIDAWRHERAAASALASIDVLAAAGDLSVPAGTNPVATMRLAVAERGMGSGVRGASAALFAALRSAPEISIRSIRWGEGRLIADVVMPAGIETDALRPAIEAAGFNMISGPVRAEGAGRATTVEVTP